MRRNFALRNCCNENISQKGPGLYPGPFLSPIAGSWIAGTVDQIIDIVHINSSQMTTYIYSMSGKGKCACLFSTTMQGQAENLRPVEEPGETAEASQPPRDCHDIMI